MVSKGQNLPWGACPKPLCIRCAKLVKLIIIILCGNSQSYRTLSDKSSECLVNWNLPVYTVYGEQDKSDAANRTQCPVVDSIFPYSWLLYVTPSKPSTFHVTISRNYFTFVLLWTTDDSVYHRTHLILRTIWFQFVFLYFSFQTFLSDLCEVPDFHEQLQLEEYMAVSRKEISIEISLSEICTLQSLLLNFKNDIVSLNYNSEFSLV